MDNMFTYNHKEAINLLKPMSVDKSVVRQSILPSLLNVANYNFARNTKDVCIYEIANTYYDQDKEEIKVGMLMTGDYIMNSWNRESIKCDFYTLKGIICNLFDYLGFNGRYSFVSSGEIPDMHPGATAIINIDNREVGYIGRVHPNISKKDIYVGELSLSTIMEKKTRNYKYKEVNKYPSISKDVAFVMPLSMDSATVLNEISRVGGKLLSEVKVFDLYRGENVKNDEKSIAYSLVFESEDRTLTTEEVNELFNKIIDEVCKKLKLTIRN